MGFGCLWHPLGQAGGPGLWPIPFIPLAGSVPTAWLILGGMRAVCTLGKQGGVRRDCFLECKLPTNHTTLLAVVTSLTKGACDPSPQDVLAIGNPGCKFILEQSEMNRSSWVWHRGRLSAAGVRDASPMAKHPRTLVRWDSSSLCPRRDGGTPSGHKDTDSQSARNIDGAECCNAIFLMTTLFVSCTTQCFQGVAGWGDLLHQQTFLRGHPYRLSKLHLKTTWVGWGFFGPWYLLPTTALPGLFQKLTLLVRNCLISTQTYVNIPW